MLYLKNGGLFVCINMCFEMGYLFVLKVILFDVLEDDVVIGKVVWIIL